MTKEVDERIKKGVIRWFGNVERVEKERIAKRVYVGECASSCSVGRLRKRWIDTVKGCSRKRRLAVRQDRNEWRGFMKEVHRA